MGKCTAAAQQYGEACAHHHSDLPFTGLDLVMVFIAGIVIIAVGYGVRRLGTGR